MTLHVQVHYEYNDQGTWRDILAVTSMADNNNITCYYVGEGGVVEHVKTQRGEEAGMFRDKA